MSFTDLFYPRTCVNCGYLGVYLCPECQKKLAYLPKQLCFYCGKPSLYGLTHPHCQRRYQIDGTLSIFYYNFLLKKIILQFKYRLVRLLFAEVFNSFNWFEQYIFLKKLPKETILQPIPLHRKRLLARGFNQALILTQQFNAYLHFKIGDYLERQVNTEPQANIQDKIKRKSNLQQAFKMHVPVAQDIPFVLIDDVLTTGATLQSAAFQLKKAGVKKIYVLTVARG